MTFKSLELDKTFETEKQLFKGLKENKTEIINLKKSQIQKSFEKGLNVNLPKGLKLINSEKNLELDENFEYVAVNTTKILDSHRDLHVKGIWNKTVKDQQGKNYLVLDHELKMSSVIVKKGDVEMFVAEIPFSSVGKNYLGSCEALIYKFPKEKIVNELAKDWLESGSGIEASVRMQYVTIKLAMNSLEPEDEEEYKCYLEYINQIANKSDFENISYFWVVTEAKNIGESSLVLQGSNSATGSLKINNEPLENTQKQEPPQGTSKKSLNYLSISENFKLN